MGYKKNIIDVNDKIGIYNDDPQETLDVGGNIRASEGIRIDAFKKIKLFGTSDNYHIDYRTFTTSTSGNMIFSNIGTGGLILKTADTDRLNILNNGNVGIGTTNPTEKLEINGNIKFSTGASIDSTTTLGANQNDLSIYAPDYIRLSAGGIEMNGPLRATNSNPHIIFKTNGGTETARIDINGNVGIGTTSPEEKLTIGGGGKIRLEDGNYESTIYQSGYNAKWEGAVSYYIGNLEIGRYLDTASFGSHYGSIINDARLPDLNIRTDGKYSFFTKGSTSKTSAGYGLNWIDNNDSGLSLFTQEAGVEIEAMTFDAPGNVGIGTTSPDYNLHVDSKLGIGDRSGEDGSLTLQSQGGPNVTMIGDQGGLTISGTTGASSSSITIKDSIKTIYFDRNVGGTLVIKQGNRGLMDSSVGGVSVSQQDTTGTNGRATYLSSDTNGPILRATSYGSLGTAGSIQFQSGGGENASEPSPVTNMVITSDGKAGIGTTSPSRKLEVNGAIKATRLDNYYQYIDIETGESNTGRIRFYSHDGNQKGSEISNLIESGTPGVNNFIDFRNGTGSGHSRMKIDYLGNIGIGTTSPSEKLHVEGNIVLGAYSNSDFNRLLGINSQDGQMTAGSSYIKFDELSSSGATNVDRGGNIEFYNHLYYGGTNLSMKIQANGNVGIGTINVASLLTLAGNNSITFTSVSAQNQVSTIRTDSSDNLYIEAGIGSGKNLRVGISNRNINIGGVTNTYQNNVHSFKTYTGSSQLYINSTGNVGIGTTSPKSKFQVDGGVQMANDEDIASIDKVGTMRYRADANNSYVEMCMQTGVSTYKWVNIIQNNF